MYDFEYILIILVLSVSILSRQITGSSYCNPPDGYPKFWSCNGETATLDKEGYQKVTLLKIHGIYGLSLDNIIGAYNHLKIKTYSY